ncbi:MAG: PmoA family protein [Chitinophagaceae bacterium]
MKKNLYGILLLLVFQKVNAQHIATLEVKLKNEQTDLAIPVQVNLDAITFLPDSILQLAEVSGKNRISTPYQIEFSNQRNICWIIEPQANRGKMRTFELIKSKPVSFLTPMKALAADGFLTISNNNKNLLRYNYKTIYPPEGIDSVYRRSGFIHPLWSPRGQELTRINAPDHYHHWGLWNPWTHTVIENDTVDFWNLAKKQGTVRFANFVSSTSGNVFAGYKALHEHVVFKKGGEQKTAISELQSIKIYHPVNNQKYYIADITIQLSCASASPVLLLEYRYGGLGLRATKDWDRTNSTITTSEGKVRKDADGTQARWVMVQGAVSGDHAGLVMMSYPANYNHPEPLRVWPEDMNKRGDVFLNFSPTKNRNWLISPGKEYLLKYRLLVFNDAFSKEQAEAAWQNFAHPPLITIKKM